MGSYSPPVDQLLKLGEPKRRTEKFDYTTLGIGPSDAPELIRLVRDTELAGGDSDTPEVYAQVHAWRALGQFRVREAIEPLLDLVAENSDTGDWDDWILDELPEVLGGFGAPVIPIVVNRIDRQNAGVTQDYASVLREVGQQNPEARSEVISHLCRLLETAGTNDATLNAVLISNLTDLKATEALPAIERAYATGNVDLGLQGGLDEAKFYMGVGPPTRQAVPYRASSHPTGQNAKQRFNERQRQKKLAKKQKKKRKGQ